MRVLHVDAGREWRGGQNQVRLLTRELSRLPGIDLRLLTRQGSELAGAAAAEGVHVVGVPWGMGLDPRAAWRLGSITRAFRPAIVHVHDSHALALGRVARWRLRRPHRPILVAHRRVDFHVRPRSGWFHADHVIAVSEAVRHVLVHDGLAPKSITVILDGIDPGEVRTRADQPLDIRKRLHLPPDTPLAVNVAALVDHKDQRTLIQAADVTRSRRPDLHWAIAGEGDLRHVLEGEIRRLHLADRVHLLGYIQEVDALIREADVFVMSSKEEGLGSVVLHAMALGKPVVSTAAGGLAELLPLPNLVPIGDADALARKVLDALHEATPVPLPPSCTATFVVQRTLALYRSLT